MIERLVLFGATGDLAARYLLPALAALRAAGDLPERFALTAAAVEDWDDDAFRRHAARELAEHAPAVGRDARDAVVRAASYRRADLEDAASVAAVLGPGDEPVAAYLALPPRLFGAAVASIGEAGLPRGSRIAVEKPFGVDLDDAVALNRLLADVVGEGHEQSVFRVDHFLALAPVQNLLGLRAANPVLEAVWSGAHVERVDVVWDETLTLEGRGYYDRSGALKDLVQNHLLQVLCLVAMDPPAELDDERELRDRKLDVLRAVRPPAPGEMAARTRRARYTAGRIGLRDVPAYTDEEGVDPGRRTETFAEVQLDIETARWAGTPFTLRTGKALARDRNEVVVRFRPGTRVPPFGGAGRNALRLGLAEPGTVTLELTGSTAARPLAPIPLTLAARLPVDELPAYGRVLREVLDGGSTLSVRGDAAEEAWRIVTPVLEAWAEDRVPLEEYPAGSDGPRK